MFYKGDFENVKLLAYWKTERFVESYFDIKAVVIKAQKLCFEA